MLYIILILAALAVWTYVQWETLSLRLFVREGASLVGSVAGAAPEVAKVSINIVKASNAKAELELYEAGREGPAGFIAGRKAAAEASKDFFAEINASCKASLEADLKALEALKA